jgi:hypothetical protein
MIDSFNDFIKKQEGFNQIDERSMSAKIRDHKNAVNMFKRGVPGYNGLMRYGVITAENPDSKPLSSQENNKLLDDLKKALKSGHCLWEEQTGCFNDNIEHSLFVFNAQLSMLKYYAGKYQQTSFIYGELIDGKIHSEYWEKQDPTQPYHKKTNPYVMKDSCDKWHDASDETDYSIIGKDFKYTIPFSIFNTIEETINENLSRLDEDQREGALMLAMECIGENAWNYRGLIYRGLLK